MKEKLITSEGDSEKPQRPSGEKENKKEIERLTFEDLKLRLQDLIQGNPKEINGKIVKFARGLRHRYSDSFNECALYHVLRSGNYNEDDYNLFDFPDPDSVEKFIVRVEKERADREDKEREISMGNLGGE